MIRTSDIAILGRMSQEMIDDLKQFITTLVLHEATDIRHDIKHLETKLTPKIDKVNNKIDDALEGIGEVITILSDTVDDQLKNHEKRLTILEQKSA